MNRMLVSLGTATLMVISIASASAKDKQSGTFLKKTIEGNFAEMSMGELAQQNGQSDAVSHLAECFPQTTPPPIKRL
ncbi:hypothetical protein [Bradyrhizobium sp. RT6a]|uniref:hypothetical protein n=1 Tax=unclassified Bradyrhizobium TaxID=2631580 RepID=UPI00339A5AD1